MKVKKDETATLIDSIIEGIFEKKGSGTVKIDMRNLDNRIADYFIICHGKSTTQVDSIVGSVENTVKIKAKEKPLHVEGLTNCFWVLLDYGNVLVHVFLEEHRNFYDLESLWADAAIESVEDLQIIN